jgi:hypothetical protein
MRELIKAEERLMFARHSAPRALRKESAERSPRHTETVPSSPRTRGTLSRKELY